MSAVSISSVVCRLLYSVNHDLAHEMTVMLIIDVVQLNCSSLCGVESLSGHVSSWEVRSNTGLDQILHGLW